MGFFVNQKSIRGRGSAWTVHSQILSFFSVYMTLHCTERPYIFSSFSGVREFLLRTNDSLPAAHHKTTYEILSCYQRVLRDRAAGEPNWARDHVKAYYNTASLSVILSCPREFDLNTYLKKVGFLCQARKRYGRRRQRRLPRV